ncbi:WD40-repeat-containing domain protein [Cunninghamella echinulata]|nr:WD40-repeat-containing domain protein [Cunninghamella echinulata]
MSASNKRCYRHRPDLANGRLDIPLDTNIDQLSALDRNAINHVWSLFSAAPQKQRNLILKGILSVCCMPQLSFIYESLQPLLRIDFVLLFPAHVNFQIFSYLDHQSLCQAAQVSRQWKNIADDERLWHKMCDQHIGSKCLKCGWGLSKPILIKDDHHQQQQQLTTAAKVNNEKEQEEQERSWKGIYKERMILEQNWRQHRYIQRELSKNKNGVIYIQSCDALQTIMIGYDDNTIHVYNDEHNSPTSSPEPTLASPMIMTMDSKIQCFQFDETKLIVGESNHTISIWDWRQQKKIRTLKGHSGPVVTLHFNHRNILVTGSIDHTIRVWDFQQSQSFILSSPSSSPSSSSSSSSSSPSHHQHQSTIKSVQLLDQHPYLISTTQDDRHTIQLWDITKKQCISEFQGHYGSIQKLLSIPLLPSIHLLKNNNSNDNQQLQHLQQQKTLIYSPFILSCSNDHTIRLWNIHTGQCINTFFGHMDQVTCIACDDLRIVTGSKDGTIRIWSYNGDMLYTFYINNAINSITLSSMGIIYSCGGEGNAFLFDYTGN